MENITLAPQAGPQKSFLFRVTPLSKVLAATLFIALPFVGFWLGLQQPKAESTPIEQSLGGEAAPEVALVAPTPVEGVATTSVFALVVSANQEVIALDYVQILAGEEAKAAMKTDGKDPSICDGEDFYIMCIHYVVNANPQIRTLAPAPDMELYDAHDFPTTLDKLKLASVGGTGRYGGVQYVVTLNSKNQITKMEEIFMP